MRIAVLGKYPYLGSITSFRTVRMYLSDCVMKADRAF